MQVNSNVTSMTDNKSERPSMLQLYINPSSMIASSRRIYQLSGRIHFRIIKLSHSPTSKPLALAHSAYLLE